MLNARNINVNWALWIWCEKTLSFELWLV